MTTCEMQWSPHNFGTCKGLYLYKQFDMCALENLCAALGRHVSLSLKTVTCTIWKITFKTMFPTNTLPNTSLFEGDNGRLNISLNK
ncbi:hypothetical protein SPOG_02596 [Schizosaccharomyces cryophilus OY26]|uniref:Uncharacterized protein n=1 Tax=Schizosaccharomyces cryophilus (strain OY26 / ATCC MYA-4695 / CBS 11777 / NBRC 106824 / NRRL Y48691) TaxID=653667 RepID=S9W063_SCHCR|nr:uncharacterized protein SPOG_02596 [Schizosaccharomyces cryophilus OY26]EPY51425.1 hypothetical protein SPOG_02596 [Schizosaccharomyces cryophilus OY26]